ncbi:hypothetical protein GQX74_011923 [Glossina fuscipes]|nr:hypothetical protein GQX74_011923 [Glossina fuscipes]
MSVSVRLRLGYAESVCLNKTATKSVSSMIFNKIFALTSSMRSGRSIASSEVKKSKTPSSSIRSPSRLSLILTKSTPNESVSSSIFSSSANTLSQVTQLRASVAKQKDNIKLIKFEACVISTIILLEYDTNLKLEEANSKHYCYCMYQNKCVVVLLPVLISLLNPGEATNLTFLPSKRVLTLSRFRQEFSEFSQVYQNSRRQANFLITPDWSSLVGPLAHDTHNRVRTDLRKRRKLSILGKGHGSNIVDIQGEPDEIDNKS